MSNAKCPQKIVTPQTYRLIRINKLTRRYTPPNREIWACRRRNMLFGNYDQFSCIYSAKVI